MGDICDQSEIDALLAEAESLATEVSGEDSSGSPVVSEAPPPPPPPAAPRFSTKDMPVEVRRILQLQVPVIVQLAVRGMSMEEVLKLNIGSIIEFDKRFDAELDLMVNDRQVGLGQAVKVGENFGLRVRRIKPINETIKAMGA